MKNQKVLELHNGTLLRHNSKSSISNTIYFSDVACNSGPGCWGKEWKEKEYCNGSVGSNTAFCLDREFCRHHRNQGNSPLTTGCLDPSASSELCTREVPYGKRSLLNLILRLDPHWYTKPRTVTELCCASELAALGGHTHSAYCGNPHNFYYQSTSYLPYAH